MRDDDLAAECFELSREDLGLWVLELPETIQGILDVLTDIRPMLKSLKGGGSDYTLHIAATIDEVRRLQIPTELAALSDDCGFSIEVVASPV